MGGEKAIGCGVGHFEDAADAWVEHRLAAQCFLDREFVAGNASGCTGNYELFREIRPLIFGCDHEKATGVFDAVGVRLAQDAILVDTLLGAARVFDHIAPAAVDEPVIAPGGAMGEVALFNEDRLKAA